MTNISLNLFLYWICVLGQPANPSENFISLGSHYSVNVVSGAFSLGDEILCLCEYISFLHTLNKNKPNLHIFNNQQLLIRTMYSVSTSCCRSSSWWGVWLPGYLLHPHAICHAVPRCTLAEFKYTWCPLIFCIVCWRVHGLALMGTNV